MITITSSSRRAGPKLALVVCSLLWSINYPAHGGTTADGTATSDGKSTTASSTGEQTEETKNWVELGIGGVIVHGDNAQFEQEHRIPGSEVYGGIQDLHFEQTAAKDVQLTVDAHALWDINDYNLRVELSKPKVGYIRFGYDSFRSWYDGNGGFFPPHGGTRFPPPFPEMHIDRGDAWVELGLRVPDWPEITIHYSHEYRDGQKDSTSWGDTSLTGLATSPTRKIVPSFRDIDEKRDIVSLDISKTFGDTDVILGMRYEHITDRDDLHMERGAGQLPPLVSPPGAQRFTTQRFNDDIDVFSGHAITETRFSDSLWFTAGYSYSTLENDVSGSRIFGADFDSAFGDPVPTLGQRDHAFIDLTGTAQIKYHVVNVNLFWMPLPTLNVITSFRYTHEAQDTNAAFLALEPTSNLPPFTPLNPENGFHYGLPAPVLGERMSDYNRFSPEIELRYTGIDNWLFFFEGEWDAEEGNVFELQTDEEAPLNKDTHFLGQKYTIGATWYPTARLSLAGKYYHKIASYDNDLISGTGQRLVSQDWNTDDVNIRVTYRPKIPPKLGTVALVTRYDFVYTSIDGQWALDTDPLLEQQTGQIKKHVITESISWNPLARFYMTTDVSVVLNETDTPASKINLLPFTSPTVVNFRNDYWTVTTSAGYIFNDKTDLRAEYSFYRANDYFNNAGVAVPYGMGATEHVLSATLTHEIAKNTRLVLRYSYYNYDDQTSGGHNNFEAHSLYSGLQYRF